MKQIISLLLLPIILSSQNFEFISEIKWDEDTTAVIELAEKNGLKYFETDESDIVFMHLCDYDYKVTFSFMNDMLNEIYIIDSSWKNISVEYLINGSRRQFSTALKRFSDLISLLPEQEEVKSNIELDNLGGDNLNIPSTYMKIPSKFKSDFKKYLKSNYNGEWTSRCPSLNYDQSIQCSIKYVFESISSKSKYKFEVYDKGFGYVTQLQITKNG